MSWGATENARAEGLGLLGRPRGELRLKVSRDAANSEVMILEQTKTRIGSAENCQLRLTDPGISPVECVILQGLANCVIRWFCDDINGELFHDGILQPGDQLQIGPVEIEILASIDQTSDASACSVESVSAAPPPVPEQPSPPESIEVLAQPEPSWENERQQLESRLQEHVELVTSLERRLAEQEHLEHEIEELRQTASTLAVELQARIDELATELARERQMRDSAPANWQAERETLLSEHQRLQLKYDSDRAQWLGDRQWLEEELDACRRQIREQHAALASSRAEPLPEPGERFIPNGADSSAPTGQTLLDQPEPAWLPPVSLSTGDEPSDEESSFAGLAPVGPAWFSHQQEPPLAGAPDEHVPRNLELAEDHCSLQPAGDASSAADILARFVHERGSADQETTPPDMTVRPASAATDNGEISSEEFDQPSKPNPLPSWPSPAPHSDSHDDESIEAYMARLLTRVQARHVEVAPASILSAATNGGPLVECDAASNQPPVGLPVEAPTQAQTEFVPRSAAPERSGNLDAMRALANDCTRTAIAQHAKSNWASVLKLKLFVTFFSLTCIAASVTFCWGNPPLMAVGFLVGLSILAYWAWQLVIYRKLLEPPSGSQASTPPPA